MQVFQKRKDGVWRNAISAGLTGGREGVFLPSLRESPYPQGRSAHARYLFSEWSMGTVDNTVNSLCVPLDKLRRRYSRCPRRRCARRVEKSVTYDFLVLIAELRRMLSDGSYPQHSSQRGSLSPPLHSSTSVDNTNVGIALTHCYG